MKAALFFCCHETTQSAAGSKETDPSLLFVVLVVDGKNLAKAFASGFDTFEKMLPTLSLSGSYIHRHK